MIRALFCAIVLWLGALPGLAQDMGMGVPPRWEAISDGAAAVLLVDEATIEQLESMRRDLVDWRARFDEAQNANMARIESLREQIDALGPAPEEGETEPPDIAEQRAELTDRLEVLMAPIREAQAAFAEADGLVAETDRIIADRTAEALLTRSAPPVNPLLWYAAIQSTGAWFVALTRDLAQPFVSMTARALWAARAVELGVLTLLALVLLLRSGAWLTRIRDRLTPREEASPAARVALMAVSLARLGLPVVGLVLVTTILRRMGVAGVRADALLTALPYMGFVILAARWLGGHAFPPRETSVALLPIAADCRREGRFHAWVLGVLMAASMLVDVFSATESDRGVPAILDGNILHFALLFLAGLSLWRLGRLLAEEGSRVRSQQDGEDGVSFMASVLGLAGKGLVVVAIIGPVVAAVGYVNLGLALVWPAILSLALVTTIGVVQNLVFDLWSAVLRRPDPAHDALAPTLVGFALAVAALPVFALIWGVRMSTLGEWWTGFLRGFRVGETRISPENFLTFAIVFVVGYLITRLLKGILRTNVLPKTRLDTGGTNAILSGTGYVGVTLAALIAITAAGIDLGGLAIVAGALSVGVGFGLQTIVQNFVSGIILLVERPIKLGDWIQVGAVEGFVRQISVRSTRIETFDRQDVIVPNADLIAGVVTNYTLANNSGRVLIPVGVAYGTDTRRIEKILLEVAENHPMVVLNPAPVVTFEGFGADSLNFLVRVVLRDILWKVVVRSELNHAVAERFRDEGIEIPFAQRDVWLRNPETLRDAERPDPPKGPPAPPPDAETP